MKLNKLLIALAFVSSSVSAQVQQSYQLETTAGWNLLGNSIQTSINVTTTYGDPNKVTSVWKWDTSGNRWMFYSPTLNTAELQQYTSANGFGVLTTIEGGEGYWVNTKVANNFGTQSGLGVISPKLGVGWNLVASGGTADSSAVSVEMFSHIIKKAVDVVSVWQWGGSKWNMYAPSLYMDGSLFTYLNANYMGAISGSVSGSGKGFWVKGDAAKVVTPLPVLRSSYENKIAAGKVLGPQAMPIYTLGYAYADFMQDGSYSMVVSTIEYQIGEPIATAKSGKIHFYEKVNNKWADTTSKMITDTSGCIHARKASVADLNSDGKPDVVFACSGYDGSNLGEPQRILLSQSNGTYKNVLLPVSTTAYGHGASVADVNGNGYADIVYTDALLHKQPFYMVNNKDGTFSEDPSRIPQSIRPKTCALPPTNLCGYGIWSTEFIDLNGDGKYDVWYAGSYNRSWDQNFTPTVFLNDGRNGFSDAQKTLITPAASGITLLDIIFENGNIYSTYAITPNGPYIGDAIEKFDSNTGASKVIYTHTGAYPAGMTFNPWIIFYNENVTSTDLGYPVSVPK